MSQNRRHRRHRSRHYHRAVPRLCLPDANVCNALVTVAVRTAPEDIVSLNRKTGKGKASQATPLTSTVMPSETSPWSSASCTACGTRPAGPSASIVFPCTCTAYTAPPTASSYQCRVINQNQIYRYMRIPLKLTVLSVLLCATPLLPSPLVF